MRMDMVGIVGWLRFGKPALALLGEKKSKLFFFSHFGHGLTTEEQSEARFYMKELMREVKKPDAVVELEMHRHECRLF